jgi:hypothetical protein
MNAMELGPLQSIVSFVPLTQTLARRADLGK